ncbi:MAG: uncharacterized protein JWM04_2305 [Verrucomicrobiales bacterium]|jgi:Ser/Thr protein kinase RdoA (MazF antagonist)|nr:uncharacterized protein [Verrucomicrobiales bacterium]
MRQLLEAHYEIGLISNCRLRAVGVNDHYLIRTHRGEFVLRLYQKDKFWVRNREEHCFEAEWLDFLYTTGAPVARPVRMKDGQHIGFFDAPEGLRYFLLFEAAPGKRTYPPTPEQSRSLGNAVAKIHMATGFVTSNPRVHYDASFLVQEPIQRITKFLNGNREGDVQFLRRVGGELEDFLIKLGKPTGAYGVIGGDFNGSNHHFDDLGRLTLFDFDFCGYGWRAYDIAMFQWSMEHVGASGQESSAFLEGYQSVRPIGKEEADSINYFAAAVQIFILGYHVSCIHWAGKSFLNDDYWSAGFGHLKILHDRLSGS